MQIYKEFDKNHQQTENYLKRNNIYDELETILNTHKDGKLNDKLFEYSLKYGVLPLTKYLYEIENYSYDLKFILSQLPEQTIVSTNNSQEMESITSAPTNTGLSNNEGLKYTIWDKYTSKRTECIQYLLKMKIYSEMQYLNGNFMYKFKKERYADKIGLFFNDE